MACVVCDKPARGTCTQCKSVYFCTSICMDLHGAQGFHVCASGTPAFEKAHCTRMVLASEQAFANDVIAAFSRPMARQGTLGAGEDVLNGTPQSSFEQWMDKGVRDIGVMVDAVDDSALVALVTAPNTNDDELDEGTNVTDRPLEILLDVSTLISGDAKEDDSFSRILCVAKEAVESMLGYFMRLTGEAARGLGSVLWKAAKGVAEYLGLGGILGKIKALVVTCVSRIAAIPSSLLAYLKKLIETLRDILQRWVSRIDGVVDAMAATLTRAMANMYAQFDDVRVHVRQAVIYLMGLPEVLLKGARDLGDDTKRLLLGIFAPFAEHMSALVPTKTLLRLDAVMEQVENSRPVAWLIRISNGFQQAIGHVVQFLQRAFIGRVVTAVIWPMQTFIGSLMRHLGVSFSKLLPGWIQCPTGNPVAEARQQLENIVATITRRGTPQVPMTLLVLNDMDMTRKTFESVARWRLEQDKTTQDVKRIKRIQRRLRAFDARVQDAARPDTKETKGMSDAQFLAYRVKERIRDIGTGGWAMAKVVATMGNDTFEEQQKEMDPVKRRAIDEALQFPEVRRMMKRRLGSSMASFAASGAALEALMTKEIDLMLMDSMKIARPDRLTGAAMVDTYRAHYGQQQQHFNANGTNDASEMPEDDPDTTDDADDATKEPLEPSEATDLMEVPPSEEAKSVLALMENVVSVRDCVAMIEAVDRQLKIEVITASEERVLYLKLRRQKFASILAILKSNTELKALSQVAERIRAIHNTNRIDDALTFVVALALVGGATLSYIFMSWQWERAKLIKTEADKLRASVAKDDASVLDWITGKKQPELGNAFQIQAMENGYHTLNRNWPNVEGTTRSLAIDFLRDTKKRYDGIVRSNDTISKESFLNKLVFIERLVGPDVRVASYGGHTIGNMKKIIFTREMYAAFDTRVQEALTSGATQLKNTKFGDDNWDAYLINTLSAVVQKTLDTAMGSNPYVALLDTVSKTWGTTVTWWTSNDSPINTALVAATVTAVQTWSTHLTAVAVIITMLQLAWTSVRLLSYIARGNSLRTAEYTYLGLRRVGTVFSVLAMGNGINKALGGLSLGDMAKTTATVVETLGGGVVAATTLTGLGSNLFKSMGSTNVAGTIFNNFEAMSKDALTSAEKAKLDSLIKELSQETQRRLTTIARSSAFESIDEFAIFCDKLDRIAQETSNLT